MAVMGTVVVTGPPWKVPETVRVAVFTSGTLVPAKPMYPMRSVKQVPPQVPVLGTKFSRVIPFFRASQPAEKAVVKAPGNVFSSAVLRPPFMSTVSLWESSDAAMDYAYSGQQAGHPEAVAANRVKPFHHQQAFIRLAIDEISGSLAGRNTIPPGAVRF